MKRIGGKKNKKNQTTIKITIKKHSLNSYAIGPSEKFNVGLKKLGSKYCYN